MLNDPLKVRCRFALLVDHFTQTGESKQILVGVWDKVFTKRQPSGDLVLSTGFLVVKLEASIAAGSSHHQRIELVDEHGASVVKLEQEIALRPAGEGMGLNATWAIQLGAIKLPAFGFYCWNIIVDGAVIGECPMMVYERPSSE